MATIKSSMTQSELIKRLDSIFRELALNPISGFRVGCWSVLDQTPLQRLGDCLVDLNSWERLPVRTGRERWYRPLK